MSRAPPYKLYTPRGALVMKRLWRHVSSALRSGLTLR